ncbi:hypothetical protein AMJ82_10520 [candidate division TA06 bacterium SM23_40]|uniref:FlgD/Vpr Ig-like domain-containing protein n=1 Tax=candidate division TA06 bacterium SM23_40 TaxID=1703774 RepID=A0A0S8G387_UNCT6|nr:MAG: hypothetical protein AMJ82_10520 [candidate division TA06 bacterium SM23_40]
MRVLMLLAAVIIPLTAGSQIMFERTYGGVDWDAAYSVAQTSDGGYIIAGETYSFGAGNGDVYLIKTDQLGDTLWTHTYGGSAFEYAASVAETDDGGYILAGRSRSFSAGDSDVYLIKTDGAGDTLWTRIYGGSENDYCRSVEQTTDGGYILCGYTSSFGAGAEDVYLLKTDAVGDTLWTRTYGGSGYDSGYSMQQTDDGGYMIVGRTTSFGAGGNDVYLIETDAAGDTIRTRTYGGSGADVAQSVVQTDDRGYIIAGYTNSWGAGGIDVYLLKTDTAGDTAWTRTYGGADQDFAYSATQTSDGGYIIAAGGVPSALVHYDAYLIKTDSFGDTVWTRTYGGVDYDEAYWTEQTTDGGYIVCGYTMSFGEGDGDVYLIKTDADGYVEVSGRSDEIARTEAHYLAQNYPNPFGSATTILYSVGTLKPVRLAVYDIRGALVRDLVDQTVAAGVHRVTWDGRDARGTEVGSGVYFCRLEAGDFAETKRMVILR